MDNIIAYKVVVKRKRWSAVAYINQNSFPDNGKKSDKYCLKYKKGNIVGAIKGTKGIFCFEAKDQAEDFKRMIDNSGYYYHKHKTIKVRGRGNPLRPRIIGYGNEIEAFYKNRDKNRDKGQRAWPGTICFPAVEVLE